MIQEGQANGIGIEKGAGALSSNNYYSLSVIIDPDLQSQLRKISEQPTSAQYIDQYTKLFTQGSTQLQKLQGIISLKKQFMKTQHQKLDQQILIKNGLSLFPSLLLQVIKKEFNQLHYECIELLLQFVWIQGYIGVVQKQEIFEEMIKSLIVCESNVFKAFILAILDRLLSQQIKYSMTLKHIDEKKMQALLNWAHNPQNTAYFPEIIQIISLIFIRNPTIITQNISKDLCLILEFTLNQEQNLTHNSIQMLQIIFDSSEKYAEILFKLGYFQKLKKQFINGDDVTKLFIYMSLCGAVKTQSQVKNILNDQQIQDLMAEGLIACSPPILSKIVGFFNSHLPFIDFQTKLKLATNSVLLSNCSKLLKQNLQKSSLFLIIQLLQNLLEIGQEQQKKMKKNQVFIKCNEVGVIDGLESLQMHKSQEVYQRVFSIILKYFDVEEPVKF